MRMELFMQPNSNKILRIIAELSVIDYTYYYTEHKLHKYMHHLYSISFTSQSVLVTQIA